MARNYAALPHEYLEEMDILSDAEFGRLCRALLQYSMTGKEVQLEGAEKVLLKRVFRQEQRFQQSYEQRTESKREAGKKGAAKRWRTMADDSTPMADMAEHSENGKTKTETETKTETDPLPSDDGKGSRARKAPPAPNDWGFGPELTEAFEDWLRYKKEKRQGYKPTGLKSLVTQVKKNAAVYGETAIVDLIRQCMAANWQGIIWDKLDKPAHNKGQKKDCQPSADRIQKNSDWIDNFLGSQEGAS